MPSLPVPILMIGAHPFKVKGGVSGCVRNILSSDMGAHYSIDYLATMVDGPWLLKLGWAIRALGVFLFKLTFSRVALVHIHGSKDASFYRKMIFLCLARVWKKRIIFHCHSGKFDQFYHQGKKWQKSLIRRVLSLSNRVVVLSPHWTLFFSQIVTPSKLRVLGNAVPLTALQSKGAHSQKSADPTILFAGLLTENKGIFDLISIIPQLRAQFPSVQVLLAGDGNMEKIRTLLRSNTLEGSVQLLGWIDPEALIGLYHQAHLFVLPSYYEGLPMVMLEAMACGLPVVSTKVGGIPEVIENGENGLLITPGDCQALLAAVSTLLADGSLRAAMGSKNIEKIKEKYDIPVYVQTLQHIYGDLLGEKL